jgi:hypothetical protein
MLIIKDDEKVPEFDSQVKLEDERKDYGRTNGANNIPPFLRQTIAITAHHDTNKNVAKAFGVSPQEVSLLKNANLPDGKDEFGKDIKNKNSAENLAIKDAIETDLSKIRREATDKLMLSLGLLTQDKLSSITRVKDLAVVAETMSKIVDRTGPRSENTGDARIVFMVPRETKKLEDYNVIEVAPITE